MGFHEQVNILWHVILASVLSGIIGYERERGDKPAGIRTNMIVGGAVTLLVLLGQVITLHFYSLPLAGAVRVDPTRIIQAIVVGVSFIGAGTVLQIATESKIKYLTTAATILFSTGIGISVALDLIILAVFLTIFILFINYFIAWVGRKWKEGKD